MVSLASTPKSWKIRCLLSLRSLLLIYSVIAISAMMLIASISLKSGDHGHGHDDNPKNNYRDFFGGAINHNPSLQKNQQEQHPENNKVEMEIGNSSRGKNGYFLPLGLRQVLERAKRSTLYCEKQNKKYNGQQQQRQLQDTNNASNNIAVDLPTLGILGALSSYRPASATEIEKWNCEVPQETECDVNTFTIIFLGHNPERLDGMKRQISGFLSKNAWVSKLVHEIIIVWNGPRELSETNAGKSLEQMSNNSDTPVRVLYPLKMGYPNDLLNRYDPRLLKVETKAILYYDDDGPFYSHDAILGAFELWKRNSNTQIGAMARRLDVGERQQAVKEKLLEGRLSERHFVPHCRDVGDSVFYNYYQFAQFGANMVLPSGTFLHSNYLCFIWHPALEEIRHFVRSHPVHPDDATVSTIVSQVSGRAPKVYSRRMPSKRRRLEQIQDDSDLRFDINEPNQFNSSHQEKMPAMRRKLLWEQEGWGDMRNDAVNSLTSYFGSINSGSVGWCNGTDYHKFLTKKGHYCDPEMARIGMLPWMTSNNRPLDVCP